jgi:hypothetical protein
MMTVKYKRRYAVGDRCWIGLGLPELVKAKVVAFYTLPDHPTVHYILEVEGIDWPHHEIRDALLMSHQPRGPLPMWQHDRPAMGADADEPVRPPPLPAPVDWRH